MQAIHPTAFLSWQRCIFCWTTTEFSNTSVIHWRLIVFPFISTFCYHFVAVSVPLHVSRADKCVWTFGLSAEWYKVRRAGSYFKAQILLDFIQSTIVRVHIVKGYDPKLTIIDLATTRIGLEEFAIAFSRLIAQVNSSMSFLVVCWYFQVWTQLFPSTIKWSSLSGGLILNSITGRFCKNVNKHSCTEPSLHAHAYTRFWSNCYFLSFISKNPESLRIMRNINGTNIYTKNGVY